MALLALLLLAIVPVAAWHLARVHVPSHVYLITGVAFGLVISPLSLGLYSTYFISPFGFPTGMLGLVSVMFHGAPGFHASVLLGLVPRGEVVSGIGHIYVELFNGILWGVVYGSLGFLVDRFRGAYPRRVA